MSEDEIPMSDAWFARMKEEYAMKKLVMFLDRGMWKDAKRHAQDHWGATDEQVEKVIALYRDRTPVSS